MNSIVKLIVKYYLIIVTLILEMQRVDKIRQLSKFDSLYNKLC
jgi:hypothetical protein